MYLAKVTGTVVSTTKHPSLNGMKLLIVTPLNGHHLPQEGAQVVVDSVGAGHGEVVIVATGSSARHVSGMADSVIDSAVVGIVDSTEYSEGSPQ